MASNAWCEAISGKGASASFAGGHTQMIARAPRRVRSLATRSDCPWTAEASAGKKSGRAERGAPARMTTILSFTSTWAKSSYPYSGTAMP